MNKYFGLRLDQLLLAHREGIEPAEVAQVCGPFRKLNPLFLTLVFLPAWLSNKRTTSADSIYRPRRMRNAERSRFVLDQHFKRLRRQLDKLRPEQRDSNWSGYMTADRHFSDDYFHAKESFVSEALEKVRPRNVLDVGCNTGHFSRLAAANGASVVAIDEDPTVIDAVWREAAANNLDVLPWSSIWRGRPRPSAGATKNALHFSSGREANLIWC